MNTRVRDLREGNWYWIEKDILKQHARALGLTAIAVYNALAYHADQDQRAFPTQARIASLLGCSRSTVLRALHRLADQHLIEIEKRGRSHLAYLLTKTRCGTPAPSPSRCVMGATEMCHQRNSGVAPVNTIKNIYQDISNKNNARSNSRRTRRSFLKYPLGDYHKVLEAFQRLKGIRLNGEEHKPILQEIKTMFLSERAPEDIVSFMEWLAASQEPWTQNWTIRTVRLKLPEFLAGKLGTAEEREDLDSSQVIASDGRIFKDIQAVQAAEARGEYYYDFQDKRYHPRRA